jgi:hypothetical protein
MQIMKKTPILLFTLTIFVASAGLVLASPPGVPSAPDGGSSALMVSGVAALLVGCRRFFRR